MNRVAKVFLRALICIFLTSTALLLWSASFAEGEAYEIHSEIPTLTAKGEAIVVSHLEKENIAQLVKAANPSSFLQNFDFGDNIDGAMFRAGLMEEYNDWMFGESDDDEEYDYWEEDWPDDTMDQSDEVGEDELPPKIIVEPPDYLDWYVKNTVLQEKIKGVFGREMIAPEAHGRYYDGSFYYNHADIESIGFGGYKYVIEQIYDLSNSYYKIVGEATLYNHVTGALESLRAYEAIIKKDPQARYTYFLIAQKFGGDDASAYDYLNVREEE